MPDRKLFRTALSGAILMAAMVVGMTVVTTAPAEEWLSGIEWPEPPVVDPGPVGGPPADAIVLFDGKDLSAWHDGDRWLVEDGVATCRGGGITSKQAFGDCQIHVEWSAPMKIQGRGQGRGNSGIYIMKKYEVQILDSYQNETYFDGQAASIYKQTPPMVNAMRKPGEWNTYDIVFTAPQFNEDGSVKKPTYITALHNGVLVVNHFELLGATYWHLPPQYEKHPDKMPIMIQDHGNPVRFRNIWVREIKPIVGKRVYKPHMKSEKRVRISGPMSVE